MSKANSYYTRSLVTNPDFLPLLKNMFDYYLTSSNKVKALEMAKRILKKEPNNKTLKDFLQKNS